MQDTPAPSSTPDGRQIVPHDASDLPTPVLLGHDSPAIAERVRRFCFSVPRMFEAWLDRRRSPNTRRAYRQDVMAFVDFLGIDWASEPSAILQASVEDVQAWRDHLANRRRAAPKTVNRRISSVSGFYRFMREAAAQSKLPILVPNPAHSQFVGRESQDPVAPTRALTATRARQLMSLPDSGDLLELRDAAILRFYLYTGARISTGCRLEVADFHQDEDDATVSIREKGRGESKRTIGIHFSLARALREYIDAAGIVSGPLFRPRLNARSRRLAPRPMSEATMYRLLVGYLERLPGSTNTEENHDGTLRTRCVFSPHSLRATTATLLLEDGVEITAVQHLLGHRHLTVTQIYDKRRRATRDSASHRMPI